MSRLCYGTNGIGTSVCRLSEPDILDTSIHTYICAALSLLHQGNGTCFFEFFRDLKKREKTDKSKKGLKVTKLTATFLCWVDCLKKALFGSF